MAAKLLQSLADENPDLQKQIGCMTGIFQIFDRHHVLSGKRITHKRLSPGSSNYGHGIAERHSNTSPYHHSSSEMSSNKNSNEKQRLSTESSRASFSSACSSSVSSLDFEKTVQQDISSYDRIIFHESSSRDPTMNISSTSPRLSRHSLDLRDVVKDSMHREARGMKHRDSPRPSQSSQVDLKESLRVLAKLREAPWYYNESREQTRSLYESRDAPRFSYDGREINRMSFESRDSVKSTIKLKELPRLSLDSRESSIRGSSLDSTAPKRPPSVVAKLMGLEALPDSTSASDKDGETLTKPMKLSNLNRSIRAPNSPRSLIKEPASPQWRNPDLIMKPISSSRFPIEPAPWKMQDGNRVSQRTSSRAVKIPAKAPNSFPSVYSEIEKRLKDLEFKQSGKDLRALKQILEAMQAKGLLESSREEQSSSFRAPSEENLRSSGQRNQQGNHVITSRVRDSSSTRTFESPIVIMKPAKLLQKPHNVGTIDGKMSLNIGRAAKDQSSKYNRKEPSVATTEKRGNLKNPKPIHSSSRTQQGLGQSDSTKSSGSVSPRLQQKKLEMEKRARPPTPPSGSNKPRKQTNRQAIESSSPGGRSRLKNHSTSQQCDDQLSEASNESKTLSCHGDDMSVLDSKSDVEVMSDIRATAELNCSMSPSIQKKATPRLDEVDSFAELGSVAPEHPSPVSVLDNSAYKDDEPSPVKQITVALKGIIARDSNDSQTGDPWKQINTISSKNSSPITVTSEINRKKLENIENLVQKLRRLNSSHDEARTDYIASLCENTNPDHRYISEILVASGLLLRDLGSGLTTFQLHPSGHPINPELFFVLEQTKASNEKGISTAKSSSDKLHRKLIFDAVNEVLVGKLALITVCHEPWLRPTKLAKKSLGAQKLLKELCHEIERFERKKDEFCVEDEDDSLKPILCEDVMCRSGNWTDFSGEISGVVLDVERSIFKDLVDEIVRGEAVSLGCKFGKRRQLFGK